MKDACVCIHTATKTECKGTETLSEFTTDVGLCLFGEVKLGPPTDVLCVCGW